MRFARLGLVIVDEEHRFGVKQKEKLKKLSQIDPMAPAEYLAMSATPIPRTLHMALSGLREVSVILPLLRVDMLFIQRLYDTMLEKFNTI